MVGQSGDEPRGAETRSVLDLWLVAVAVVLTGITVFAPVLSNSHARTVAGLLFVLFVPGYAFVAALFPERHTSTDDETGESLGIDTEPRRGIDGLERVVLPFGASIALVPLVGLALNFTPWGITLVPVFVALGGLALGLTAVAWVRRQRLPPERRFSVPTGSATGVRRELLEPSDRTDALLNVLLVVSVLVAASSVAFAVTTPAPGEEFTEFHLLTENETGELVADDFPTNFTRGEPRPLVVGVTNQEGEPTNYTVVVELQRVNVINGEIRVQKSNRLDQFERELQPGETWHQQHTVTPRMSGERLRLTYLLYRGSPPREPRTSTAYRHAQLWVSVSNASTTSNASAT